jgi:hypothetical protein
MGACGIEVYMNAVDTPLLLGAEPRILTKIQRKSRARKAYARTATAFQLRSPAGSQETIGRARLPWLLATRP